MIYGGFKSSLTSEDRGGISDAVDAARLGLSAVRSGAG
jgi:hypothetical protein